MKKYKKVEVIVLPCLEENIDDSDPMRFMGFMKDIDMDVEEEIKAMRTEWERDS